MHFILFKCQLMKVPLQNYEKSYETLLNWTVLFTMPLIYWVKQGSTCIINAASERDMAVFAAGMTQA